MFLNKQWVLAMAAAFGVMHVSAQTVNNFDTINLHGTDTFSDNASPKAGFRSGQVFLPNTNHSFYWEGFSISNVKDSSTAGYGNQYAARAYTDVSGNGNYAVSTGAENTMYFTFDGNGDTVKGMAVTNATYAYTSMRDGDMFAKKFSVSDSDYFHLTFIGYDRHNTMTGSKSVFLADFRNQPGNTGTILEQWEWVDLSSLGRVAYIETRLTSNDNSFGFMNTPAYFCVDSIVTTSNNGEFTPFAYNDMDTVSNEKPVAQVSVVANDTEPNGDSASWSIAIIDVPQLGTAVVNQHTVEYTTDTTQEGRSDHLTYSICNTHGNCDTAMVHFHRDVEVAPVDSSTVISELLTSASKTQVFPNPTTGKLTVQAKAGVVVQVIDASGKVQAQRTASHAETAIDLTNAPEGVYLVRIFDGDAVEVHKIQVK